MAAFAQEAQPQTPRMTPSAKTESSGWSEIVSGWGREGLKGDEDTGRRGPVAWVSLVREHEPQRRAADSKVAQLCNADLKARNSGRRIIQAA